MLHEFVTVNRDEIIQRCRTKVAARSVPPRTASEIDQGVPLFLDQLVHALRLGLSTSPEIGQSAVLHGHDLRRQGFTVSQVVHDYGDVCQAITEMAMELNTPIRTDDFRLLNGCLDDAIAGAVTQYGGERDQSRDGEAGGETERLRMLLCELRNSIYTASAALHMIQSGMVGIAGGTGTVLDHSLLGAHDLIDSLLAEVESYTARRTTDPVR